MDAVEQLGVFLGDGVLKREIEQTLEEAFSFGHVGCLQNMRCIRHSFPPKFGMSSLGSLSLSLAPNGLCEKPLCPLPLPNPLRCLSQAAPCSRSGSWLAGVERTGGWGSPLGSFSALGPAMSAII